MRSPQQPLTRREGQLVQAVIRGESTKEIAARFGTSPHTVKNQLIFAGLLLALATASHAGAQNGDTPVVSTIADLSGPAFGQPTAWVDARTIRAAVRFSF